MHMADVDKNFWGGHAIVGAHLPIAAGLALGDQYQEPTASPSVCSATAPPTSATSMKH